MFRGGVAGTVISTMIEMAVSPNTPDGRPNPYLPNPPVPTPTPDVPHY
jgi:hypothetical protein